MSRNESDRLRDDHLKDSNPFTEREGVGRKRERERSGFGAHSKEVVLVFWGQHRRQVNSLRREAATMNEHDISAVCPCLWLPSVNFSPCCFHAWFMWCVWYSSIFPPCFTRQETTVSYSCCSISAATRKHKYMIMFQRLHWPHPLVLTGLGRVISFPAVWLWVGRADAKAIYLWTILAKLTFFLLQYTCFFFFFQYLWWGKLKKKEGGLRGGQLRHAVRQW